MKICIDMGHGGKDSGAAVGDLKEKDVVLELGKKLKEVFDAYKIESFLTRDEDEFLTLKKRVEIANLSEADFFISLHCNAASNRAASGTETFHFRGSNGGSMLAGLIQDEMDKLPRRNRGAKEAGFYVTRYTSMPAVLFEFGFLTNPVDACWVQQDLIQYDIAEKIVRAFIKY